MKRSFAAAAAILAFLIFGLSYSRAMAADAPVVFGEEDPDLPKGGIRVYAVIEKGFEAEIAVELIPLFTGGSYHVFLLNRENGYCAGGRIAAGEYSCAAYIKDPQSRAVAECAESTGVVRKGEDPTYVFAAAGSRDFVDGSLWLADYRDPDGGIVRGVITMKTVWEKYKETIGLQKYPDDEAAPEGQEQEVQEDGAAGKTPVPEEEGKERQHTAVPYLHILAIAAAAAVFVLIRRRRPRDGRNG